MRSGSISGESVRTFWLIISCILYTPFDDCGGSPFFPVQR